MLNYSQGRQVSVGLRAIATVSIRYTLMGNLKDVIRSGCRLATLILELVSSNLYVGSALNFFYQGKVASKKAKRQFPVKPGSKPCLIC